MKDSAKYAKIVEWSEEDQCYVGSAPGLIPALSAAHTRAHSAAELLPIDQVCGPGIDFRKSTQDFRVPGFFYI